MENDSSLFTKFREGDLTSFEALYTRYKDRIYSYILSIVKDVSEAEVIMQDVFTYLLTNVKRIRIKGSFKSMLYVSARNRALNYLRDARRRRRGALKANSAPPYLTSPLDRLIEEEDRRLLKMFVEEIPEDQREVIFLKTYGGLTFKEIAQIFRIPIGTIASRYNLGLRKLKELFEKAG